jgi:hypothetical protein
MFKTIKEFILFCKTNNINANAYMRNQRRLKKC